MNPTKPRCPKCGSVEMVLDERDHVEIDVCPNCRGVWLDCGELEALVGEPVPFPAGIRAPREWVLDEDDRLGQVRYALDYVEP